MADVEHTGKGSGPAPSANGTTNGHAATLLPQHLEDLRRSGLTDETIATAALHSLNAKGHVRMALNWSAPYNDCLGACLAIPFHGLDGQRQPYMRLKPDRPRKKKGSIVKYESPLGQPNRPYFPPAALSAIKDPAQPLFITEGEKKALKATQDGFPCIGLVGVWGWQKPKEKAPDGRSIGARQLADELTPIPWEDRAVYVCCDSDAATNPDVWLAEWCLAEELRQRKATVKVVRLPAGPAGADGKPGKVGIDDYLVAHGPEAFRRLLAEAREPVKPEKGKAKGGQAREDITDPHRLARQFLLTVARHPDRWRVAFYREQFWRWMATRWIAVPDAEMRGELATFCKKQLDQDAAEIVKNWTGDGDPPPVPKVTTALVSNVLQALTGGVLVSQETPQPSWLGAEPSQRNYIALRNGILDIDKFLAGEPSPLVPHTPHWFSPVCLPYRFDPSADCPRWLAFLARNLGDCPDKAVLLQQFAGYLWLTDTSFQRFLMMVGEGANGKSVVQAVLRGLLGQDNVSSVPLELFGDKFRLAGTLGKLANIVPEVGELDRIAEGQLKAFVSGDPIEFERKFKTPFTARPTARLVLSTNNVPQFSDKSDGLWRRVLLLQFVIQIPEAERIANMDTTEYWAAELPGILNWSLDGMDKLRQQGRFVVPATCQAAVDRLRTDSNPARRFLQEHYQAGSDEIPSADLYATYREWCQRHGHYPLADGSFGREVARRFPQVERKKITPADGRGRCWGYCGLEKVVE